MWSIELLDWPDSYGRLVGGGVEQSEPYLNCHQSKPQMILNVRREHWWCIFYVCGNMLSHHTVPSLTVYSVYGSLTRLWCFEDGWLYVSTGFALSLCAESLSQQSSLKIVSRLFYNVLMLWPNGWNARHWCWGSQAQGLRLLTWLHRFFCNKFHENTNNVVKQSRCLK